MGLLGTWWPLAVMALDWLAVARNWKRLEYAAKPAAMLALLGWLWINSAATGHSAPALGWFAAGVVFSLAGDVMLLLPERFFLGGLIAFLLGHIAYSVGLNASGLLWPMEAVLLAPVALAGGWLVWRISAALEAKGRAKLLAPVRVYGAVISLMVVSALTMLFRPNVPAGAAVLVASGAVLFFVSDAVLAWNRFVAPVPAGKLLVIVTYHLGQMALIAGAVALVTPASFGS